MVSEPRASAVWRSLPLRLVIVAVPLWFTVAVLIFNVGWLAKLTIGSVLAVTLAAPPSGLLLVALLAPLGQLVAILAGPANFRIGEAIVVAFLVGWVLRGAADRRGPRAPAPAAGWLFATAVVTSIAAAAWQLSRYRGELSETFNLLFFAYYLAHDRIGFVDGARLLESVGLVVATVTLFAHRPRLANTLPAALAASGTIAAIASVLLWRGVALTAILQRQGLNSYRVSAHVADLNAAGGYFAMVLCLALGMTLRTSGRQRVAWAAASAANAVGLWLSQSRTAFAAAGIVILVAATWYAMLRSKPAVRATVVGVALAVGLAVFAYRVHRSNFGVDYRQQFNATSLRMIAARPLFGVGVGQYYQTSALFMSPQLAWNYGFENAHNNFFQIGAELGLVGLGLFVVWMGSGLLRAARALAREPRDPRLLGAASGVVVFAGTWLTSHPLLVDEVAFPFWIQFGLVAALAGSTLLNAGEIPAAARRASPAWPRAATVIVGLCLMLTIPVGVLRGPIEPPRSRDVDGFYAWETTGNGVPIRWSERYASLFVPADVTRIYLPVHTPAEARLLPPLEVEVMVKGRFQGHAAVSDDGWTILELALPDVGAPARFKRIDLRVDRTWQPALHIAGNADMRSVGIQVGEAHLFRER